MGSSHSVPEETTYIDHEECRALTAFFHATSGPAWNHKKGWNTDASLENWVGVTVENGHVVKLDLGWNNLRGSIPPELGDLQNLQKLHLYDDKLTGSIPPELGSLEKLKHLILGSNKLTGSIPAELGSLEKLEVLYLFHTELSGSIPPQLGQLPNLRELWLHGNNLEGEIPPELGGLRNLETLFLNNNYLTGDLPKELGGLSQLTSLHLGDNKLTGSIPHELGGLQNLEELDLINNKLTEISLDAARGLQKLSKLQTLQVHLHGNPWTAPSADVVAVGFEAVERYWIDLSQGEERSWKLKVVLVGRHKAGKTTLALSLMGRQRDPAVGQDESTVGIETHAVRLGEDESRPLELVIWDFAGQRDYYAYHQLCLTARALYVLTINLEAFSGGSQAAERDLVIEWLDALQAYAPGSVVVVLGSHVDTVEPGRGGVDKVVRDVKKLVDRVLKTHRKRAGTIEPLKVQEKYWAVDLTDKNDVQEVREYIEWLALEGSTKETPSTLFPDVGKMVPLPWVTVRLTLEACQDELCIGDNKLQEKWSKSEGAEQLDIEDPKKTFEVALKLQEAVGAVLWLEGYVHVNPLWLMALVKPLASHKLTEATVKHALWRSMLGDMAHSNTGTNELMELPSFDILHEEERNFLDKATTSSDYLFCLWQLWVSVGHQVGAASCEEGVPVKKAFQRLEEDTTFFKGMLETLAQHGVILPVTGLKDEEGRKDVYVAPTRLRLGGGGNTDVRKVVTTFLKAKSEECTRGHFKACNAHFPSGTLPFLLAWFLGKRSEEPHKKVVQIRACAKYAAALRVNHLDVLIMVEGGDLLLYVTSDVQSNCREVGGMVRNWIREMLGERFKGLAFMSPEESMESIASGRQPLAAELRLLGDEYAKDDAAQFDVFLSHAGPDKWGLVYNLWVALWDSGVTAFLDREDLQLGRQAPDYMVSAAKKAKIGLVVLSPQFLCREWCLKETEIFMERLEKKEEDFLVVPLFYKLTPGDCYDGTERLLKAHPEIDKQWDEWREKDEPEKGWPEAWQKLLPELSNQTGKEYEEQQYEADYVEKVREHIQDIIG